MENDHLQELKVKIFADGANLEEMVKFSTHPYIKGFTTNPTLMRQAGIVDYEAFAHQALAQITKLPISFEVFADELDEMEDQARYIASWGNNVNIKIPVTNTKGQFRPYHPTFIGGWHYSQHHSPYYSLTSRKSLSKLC